MGQGQGRINVPKLSSCLRQAMSRISIHRSKKLTSIAKKKDDIAKHLEAGNEVNAKIWAETLINDEGMVPCFDIVSILCDQLNGRLKTIEKFGPPKDMDQNFRTLIYAAPRIDIEELTEVRRQLGKILGKDFVLAADSDEQAVNKVVAANINIRIPEEGEKIKRLVEIAKERNIDYKPSAEALMALREYCDRKGIENPLTGKCTPVVDNMVPAAYNPNADYMQYQPQQPPPPMGGQQQAYLPPPAASSGGMPGQLPPSVGMNMSYVPVQGYQMMPMMPPQGPPPMMGAPVVEGNPYTYYHQPGQPMNPAGGSSRGYSLYDPSHGAGTSVVNGVPQPGASGKGDEDDFMARLENLKKL